MHYFQVMFMTVVMMALLSLLPQGLAADIGLHLPSGGVLYPRPSEVREVISLDGIWNFVLDSPEQEGLRQQWFNRDLDRVSTTRRHITDYSTSLCLLFSFNNSKTKMGD